MTANELIETAEKAKTQEYGHTDDWIKNASILLRQQQAEIEQLKALVISLSPNANLIYTKVSENE